MRFPNNRTLVFAILLTAGALCAANSSAEVVVVVSARNPVSSLTAAHIAKIFLGKISAFPGGGSAVPLDQEGGTPARNEFYAKVIGKDSSQLNAYWSRVIFAGDGQPPRVVTGNTGIKKAIASDPSAIGYIDRSAVDDSVRIVLTP